MVKVPAKGLRVGSMGLHKFQKLMPLRQRADICQGKRIGIRVLCVIYGK